METTPPTKNFVAGYLFRSYLRGMETLCMHKIDVTVFRNSDPTYEAWKLVLVSAFLRSLFWFRSYLRGMETAKNNQWVEAGWLFRSYLRGMETIIWLWVESCGGGIPILPTRHGNWGIIFSLERRCTIPILPTRHGNTPLQNPGDSPQSYSDPTYEAWKHLFL